MQLPRARRKAAAKRRARSRWLLTVSYVIGGTLHFTHTRHYEAVMPPYLPARRELVYISGAAEVAGGIGAQIPETRRAAGIGLIALLIAVFPANVHMALHPEVIKGLSIPRWLLWARLPLQLPLVLHAWRVTRDP